MLEIMLASVKSLKPTRVGEDLPEYCINATYDSSDPKILKTKAVCAILRNIPVFEVSHSDEFFHLRWLLLPDTESIQGDSLRELNLKYLEAPKVIDLCKFTTKVALTGAVKMQKLENVLDSQFSKQELESIYLPSVRNIGEKAFQDCQNLKEVELGAGCHINHYGFSGCTNLGKISVESFSYIGQYAFQGCNSIVNLSLTENNLFDDYAFNDCKGLKSIDISRDIGTGVFSNCTSLENVIIKGNIGNYSFFGCKSLEHISSNETKIIGEYSFAECTKLRSVEFDSVISIGYSSFDNCSLIEIISLRSITCLNEPDIFSGLFNLSTCLRMHSIYALT